MVAMSFSSCRGEWIRAGAAALAGAGAFVATLAGAAASGTPEEFVATDLADARGALEEVTGARTPDDVLRHIFETFCIGK